MPWVLRHKAAKTFLKNLEALVEDALDAEIPQGVYPPKEDL